jgi:thiamine-monophosphate kinase
MPPTELEIIRKIEKLAGRIRRPWVRLGIGDDAAAVQVPTGHQILLTTDQVIEKTHFTKDTHPPGALGHKILARGLSDIAAMGGRPLCCLLSLQMPGWATGAWLSAFLSQLLRLSKNSDTPLVGGDVARGRLLAAVITVAGSAPPGDILTRGGARPGDIVYVSGRLGGSAAGLEKLLSRSASAATLRDGAVRRHLWPEPRLSLGRTLRKLGATAAMDLSDGLAMDLTRLTKASGAGAEIEAALIPLFPGASLKQALHGGEEYELLFTLPPLLRPPASFEKIPLTLIGRIRRQPGVALRSGSRVEKLKPEGFQHFGR